MKKILVLNHFPTVSPPTSGGTLRYFHLYHKLSEYYDITLLSQSSRQQLQIIEFSPTFREYQVGKDSLHNWIRTEGQAPNSYEFALIMKIKLSQHPTLYKKYFDAIYKKSDIIIHESPYLLKYDRYLGLDGKLRIYNSHNHEYLLADQIWENKTAREFLPSIYELEKRLVEYADLVFATSTQERQSFIAMYNIDSAKVKLAPNGIIPEDWTRNQKAFNTKPNAFFIGAEYPPNIEVVHYIIHHLADKCPNIKFIIAGGCCAPFRGLNKSNVKLLGRITNKEKLKLFENVDIAINPMFKGAGVNLKTLEFLSAGLPLFSTQFGVRGLNLLDKKHYINAEREEFADKLNNLYFHSKDHLKEIAAYGQKYINKNYSWHKIAKNLRKEIDNAFNKKTRQ